MAREDYMRQVELLFRTLPFIAKQEVFALKGGRAINHFYRDMPLVLNLTRPIEEP